MEFFWVQDKFGAIRANPLKPPRHFCFSQDAPVCFITPLERWIMQISRKRYYQAAPGVVRSSKLKQRGSARDARARNVRFKAIATSDSRFIWHAIARPPHLIFPQISFHSLRFASCRDIFADLRGITWSVSYRCYIYELYVIFPRSVNMIEKKL